MPHLLMIDNYDSFTYNLVQYFGELGATVIVHRNDAISVPQVAGMDAIDGIVLSPGPCTPNEAGICLDLVSALSGIIPILGVCLGHQAIAQVFGGRIVRAQRIMHGKTSEIHHNNEGVFRDLPNPFVATRYHSLVADPGQVPAALTVTARTSDGEIMGLRHQSHPTQGVQFHPESILTIEGHHLLRNFLESL